VSSSSGEDQWRDAERNRLLLEHTTEMIWTMSLDGSLSSVNPAFARLRHSSIAEALAEPLEEHLAPSSAAICLAYLARQRALHAEDEELEEFHGELDFRGADGAALHCEVQLLPLQSQEASHLELVGISRDLSEHAQFQAAISQAKQEAEEKGRALRAANEELRRLAATDPLTGARNRLFFEQAANVAVASRDRYGQPATLLMLDLDHFKSVNDEYGHQVGDQVLCELVDRILGRLRVTDSLVRWGGEEFIVLMTHNALTRAMPAAEHLCALVASRPFARDVTLTVSIGLAQLTAGDTVDSSVARADEAIYAAKAVGRNVCYSAG
jgi:diguanylate cyclase (GGDEF)-like protein/PAS domain S-box-containing protein